MHHFLYAAWDAWDEAVRLISWFGVPLLTYAFLPLTALTAVMGRQRTFKVAVFLTLLLGTPTALYWDGVWIKLIQSRRDYRSAPPAAPAKRNRGGRLIALERPHLDFGNAAKCWHAKQACVCDLQI